MPTVLWQCHNKEDQKKKKKIKGLEKLFGSRIFIYVGGTLRHSEGGWLAQRLSSGK